MYLQVCTRLLISGTVRRPTPTVGSWNWSASGAGLLGSTPFVQLPERLSIMNLIPHWAQQLLIALHYGVARENMDFYFISSQLCSN